MEACSNGHESTAKLLLDTGADINLCNKDGWTPLIEASLNDYLSMALT